MSLQTESETTTPTRIRNTTLVEIAKLMKTNPIFDTPAEVIDYAIDELKKKGVRK